MVTEITRNSLADDYSAIGLKKGDIVLMRAALRAIGKPNFTSTLDHINAIFDVIGPEGTLVGLSFTKNYITPFSPPKDKVFKNETPAVTGAFANLLLSHPQAIRSLHPTNSFVAIGARAADILEGHDDTTHSYFPMEKILALNGKMIVVGCVENSPGFTTAHLAEYNLGLLHKILFTRLHRTWFYKDGKLKIFKRRDIGGDSKTFSRFYGHYVRKEKLKTGYIGNAYSIMINAEDAYEIEYSLLKENPRFAICDDIDCQLCKGRTLYNKRAMPLFYLRLFFLRMPKIILNKLLKTMRLN